MRRRKVRRALARVGASLFGSSGSLEILYMLAGTAGAGSSGQTCTLACVLIGPHCPGERTGRSPDLVSAWFPGRPGFLAASGVRTAQLTVIASGARNLTAAKRFAIATVAVVPGNDGKLTDDAGRGGANMRGIRGANVAEIQCISRNFQGSHKRNWSSHSFIITLNVK